ncbi:MAG: hypothetical protein WBV64_02800 [Mycobacterium sp.]
MAEATERQALADSAAERGWNRRAADRVDIYLRGASRIRVIWQGEDDISGGSRHQDDMMEQYTRELATVKGWLAH